MIIPAVILLKPYLRDIIIVYKLLNHSIWWMDNQKQRAVKRRAITPSRRRHIDGVFSTRSNYSHRPTSRQSALKPSHKSQTLATPIKQSEAVQTRTDVVPGSRLERAQKSPRNSSINRFHKHQNQSSPNSLYPKLPQPVDHHNHQAPQPKGSAGDNPTVPKRFWLWRLLRKLYITIPLALVVLIGSGWLVYQQVPQISLQIINLQADFQVNLPKAPAGFSISGPLTYSNQQALVQLTGGDESIDINQQASSLDSSSLATQLAQEPVDYQTSTLAGRTIFIRQDQRQASWVNKGVLYTLSSNFDLNQQQVFEIAESL